MQTQGQNVKDPCPKKSKVKETKPICIKIAKLLEQKDKKKKTREHKQNYIKKQKKTLAISNNTINFSKIKKKKSVILVKSRILTAIKNTIIPVPAENLQKTSIGLSNIYANK